MLDMQVAAHTGVMPLGAAGRTAGPLGRQARLFVNDVQCIRTSTGLQCTAGTVCGTSSCNPTLGCW
jgi:hypothetical protein